MQMEKWRSHVAIEIFRLPIVCGDRVFANVPPRHDLSSGRALLTNVRQHSL
jgi:hypothetical protein